jgi:hypothetical protein
MSPEFRGWFAIRRALAGAVIRWKHGEIIPLDGYPKPSRSQEYIIQTKNVSYIDL